MVRDLDNILVVALEQAVAAPYASSRLADFGARVIKIERPEGDFARDYDHLVQGQSAYFVWLNRGKQSIALDIKNPADRGLLEAMIARADVFIQNLVPGATLRLYRYAASLRARHPRLITCDISGYGESGPYRDKKAYDLLVQAESGLCSINGSAAEPARVGISVCDIAAGVSAHQAILQALYARARTGEGRAIKISLFAAMADWMSVPYLQFAYGGQVPARTGLHHPSIAPYGAYPCAGGEQVLIAIQNEREWRRLCADVLGQPALAADPRFSSVPQRVANRAALNEIIAGVFGQWSRAVAMERLREAGIACGRLNSLDDLGHHPQVRFATVATPEGEVRLIAPPAQVEGSESALGAVPTVDEHGALIRAEFGPQA